MQGTAATAVPLSNTRDVRLTECFVLSWVSGLLLCALCHQGTVASALLTAAIGFCILFAVCLLCRYAKRRVIACILGGTAALCSWNSYTFLYAKPLLALDGQTASVAGVITDSTPYDGGTVRYTVRFSADGLPANAYWYAANAEAETVLQIGDKICGEVTFATSNSEYNAQRNVFLMLRGANLQKCGSSPVYALKRMVRGYRDECAAIITQHMPKQNAALLLGMLFGDDRELSADVADALYQTGIGHVLSVSGLHLVFFCTALSFLLRRLRLGVRAVLCGNLIAMALFVIMVDSAISVMRAAIMLLLSLIAPVFGRKRDAGRSLCIAMLICTLPTPYVIGSASFWLSVSGVFGLTILAPYMRTRRAAAATGFTAKWYRFCSLLAPMVWVWLAVLPAAVLLCGETSLLSVISNLVLLPLCTMILALGLLSVAFGGVGVIFLPFANVLCRIVLTLAKLLAGLPYATLSVVHPSTRILLLLAVALLMLLRLMHYADPKRIRAAMIAIGGILLLQMSVLRLLENQTLSVALLGAADAPALVCIADDTVLVIDQNGDSDHARLVADYLEARGRHRVTALILPDLQNAAAYDDRFHSVHVDRVYIAETAGLREDAAVCGCVPVSGTVSELTCSTDDVSLTWQKRGCLLQWGSMTVPIFAADTPWEGAYATAITTGERIAVANDGASPVFYEENIQFRFYGTGAWKAETIE